MTGLALVAAPAGDPQVLAATGDRMRRLGMALAAAGAGLTVTDHTSWRGLAAAQFTRTLALHPDRFTAAAQAMTEAASSLEHHAAVLAEAQHRYRIAVAAASHDPVTAGATAGQAWSVADSSARTAAARLGDAAGRAPRRPSGAGRAWHALDQVRAETALGASEATASVLRLLVTTSAPYVASHPQQTLEAATGIGPAARAAASHPWQTLKALLDWDTWRDNPARAAGRLAPDVALAFATGGLSATSKAATSAARAEAAVRRGQALDAARRGRLEGLAIDAKRERQTELFRTGDPVGGEWRGEDGLALPQEINAYTEAYRAALTAVEPDITRRMAAISDQVGGELVGLDHRLKEPDSLKRKVATTIVEKPEVMPFELGAPPSLESLTPDDVVRYTIVLPDETYVQGARAAAAVLDAENAHLSKVRNGWVDDRPYRGLNTTWIDPRTGLGFEVQFHTPRTWEATVSTHPAYDERRLPDTTPERRAELDATIAAAYAQAPLPEGVGWMTDATMRPATPVLLEAHVPDPVGDALAAAAAGTSAAAIDEQAPPGHVDDAEP